MENKWKINGKEYKIDIEDFEIPEEIYDYMTNLHKETETVLQIILSTQSFELGLYENEEYTSKWTKVKDDK